MPLRQQLHPRKFHCNVNYSIVQTFSSKIHTKIFFLLRDLGQKSCIRAKTIVIKTIMVMSIISELSLCTPHCPFVLFRCMVSSICMAAVGFSFPTIDVLYPVSISSMVPYYQYGVSMES